MNEGFLIASQLIVVHVFTDFVLQSSKQVKHKIAYKHKSWFLYVHAFLSGFLTYLILQQWGNFLVPIFIMITHFFIDLWKLNQKRNNLKLFVIDQMFHGIVLVLCWMYLTEIQRDFWFQIASVFNSFEFLVLLTGYLIVIYPVSFVIGMATQRWQNEIEKEEKKSSLRAAGRYIGIFERILVLTFVITDNIEGIGFLIAAKSILRFTSKSKSGGRKQTEYVLIGTLMSFALTIVIGFLIRILIF